MRQIQVWVGFLLFALRRYWWIVLIFSLLGGIWGYVSSLSTTNRYEVRAAFLIPADQAPGEYERLLSRRLVANSISKFSVSRWIDRGDRGLHEMYNESPFDIAVLSIPPHLQNQRHAFRLMPDHQFEITLGSHENAKTYRGKIGDDTQAGAVLLRVQAREPIEKWQMDSKFFVQFNSEERVVSRFLSNLEVQHGADRPNRIELHYTDAHPDLALDMMDAFTQAYLVEYHRQLKELSIDRQREIETEMKVLEEQILKLDHPEPFLRAIAEAGNQLPAKDSSAIQLLSLRQETHDLMQRIQLWKAMRAGAQDRTKAQSQLQKWQSQPYDSIVHRWIAEATRQPDVVLENTSLDSLISWDQKRLDQLNANVPASNSQYLSALKFQRAWAKEFLTPEEDAYSLELLLREKYLSALEESAEIELELRKYLIAPQLIDPPYPVSSKGRTQRIKILAASVLGLMMLGMVLALLLARMKRRFSSAIHFLAVSGNTDRLWQLEANALERRQQLARMELLLHENQKCIAFVGQWEQASAVAQGIAADWAAFGKNIAIVNAAGDEAIKGLNRISIPAGATAGWWFSQEAKAFLEEQTRKYDRVLLCLPSPDQVPEVLAALDHSQMIYYVLRKNQTKVSEWTQWESTAEELGFEFQTIWVG